MGEERRRYRALIMDNARWDGFAFRDDDIVISTPSKCGTTWTQMIVALLVFQDPALPQPLTELSPWMDVQTRAVADVHAALDAQTHRRFIKTHTPLDGLPRDDRVTYICVARDPRDVALSWDHHFNNLRLDNVMAKRAAAVGLDDLAEIMREGPPVFSDDPIERFWTWVDEDLPVEETLSDLKGTLHHIDTFWTVRDDDNVILLHYADLKADLEGQMRRLASALAIDVPEDRWPVLVEAATFDKMRDRASELAPQVTDGFWQADGQFFHKGSSGQWRDFFGPEDQARYDRRVKELATDDLAAWIHRG